MQLFWGEVKQSFGIFPSHFWKFLLFPLVITCGPLETLRVPDSKNYKRLDIAKAVWRLANFKFHRRMIFFVDSQELSLIPKKRIKTHTWYVKFRLAVQMPMQNCGVWSGSTFFSRRLVKAPWFCSNKTIWLSLQSLQWISCSTIKWATLPHIAIANFVASSAPLSLRIVSGSSGYWMVCDDVTWKIIIRLVNRLDSTNSYAQKSAAFQFWMWWHSDASPGIDYTWWLGVEVFSDFLQASLEIFLCFLTKSMWAHLTHHNPCLALSEVVNQRRISIL